MIKIVNTLEELDSLIQILTEGQKEIGINGDSLSGFIAWLVTELKNVIPNTTRTWYILKDNKPVEVMIATIERRFYRNECTIIFAFSTDNCNNETQEIVDSIFEWAKAWGCKKVHLATKRKGIIRKYGFKEELIFLTKEVT